MSTPEDEARRHADQVSNDPNSTEHWEAFIGHLEAGMAASPTPDGRKLIMHLRAWRAAKIAADAISDRIQSPQWHLAHVEAYEAFLAGQPFGDQLISEKRAARKLFGREMRGGA